MMNEHNSYISAIVLAAGLSRRAYPRNKLLTNNDGRPLVRSTVEAVCAANVNEVIVIVGYQHDKIEAALVQLPVTVVYATDFVKGIGYSLAAGVRAAAPNATGFMITVADLPRLSSVLCKKVLHEFTEAGQQSHLIPTYKGQRGHPVVLGSWIRAELERLESDIGARDILDLPSERARTRFYETLDEAVVKDIDI